MTWGQFFLGLVTILVATIVYRWQKTIDRQSGIASELRSTYAAYLKAETVLLEIAEKFRSRQSDKDTVEQVRDAKRSLLLHLKIIDIMASTTVAVRFDRHYGALMDLVDSYERMDANFLDLDDQKTFAADWTKNNKKFSKNYEDELTKLMDALTAEVREHSGFSILGPVRAQWSRWRQSKL